MTFYEICLSMCNDFSGAMTCTNRKYKTFLEAKAEAMRLLKQGIYNSVIIYEVNNAVKLCNRLSIDEVKE